MGDTINKRAERVAFTRVAAPLVESAGRAAAAAALAVALTCPISARLPLVATKTAQAATVQAGSVADTEHALAAEAWAIVRAHHVGNVKDASVWETEAAKLGDAPLRARVDTYNAVRGALRQLGDRQERLLAPSDMEALRRFGSASVGIELELGQDGNLMIASPPAPGSAAAEAGLKVGDTLLRIDGVSVQGLALDEASNLLEQSNGAAIRVGMGQAGEVVLIPRYGGKRARGGYKPVRSSVITDSGGKHTVGYVRAAELRPEARDDVKRAVETLSASGADAWVLDLRGNTGGSFDTAMDVASVLIESGTLVTVVEQGSGELTTYAARGDRLSDISISPLAIVVDKETSGEAEVLASALSSRCRAVVLGERTRGRTGIQAVFPLSDGAGLVLTVAEYRAPDASRIQGRGVEPDVSVSASAEKISINWDMVENVSATCRVKE